MNRIVKIVIVPTLLIIFLIYNSIATASSLFPSDYQSSRYKLLKCSFNKIAFKYEPNRSPQEFNRFTRLIELDFESRIARIQYGNNYPFYIHFNYYEIYHTRDDNEPSDLIQRDDGFISTNDRSPEFEKILSFIKEQGIIIKNKDDISQITGFCELITEDQRKF